MKNAEIQAKCPHCHTVKLLPYPYEEASAVCVSCSADLIAHPTLAFHNEGRLDQCPICGSAHLYRQKDFNRRLGVAIVLFGVLFSYYTYGLSLLLVAVIDWLIYRRVGEVASCYACHSVYRGFSSVTAVPPFNLSLHDYYRSIRPTAAAPSESSV
jgi:predicted RNA-binding Zn-ribbon protein involved in translation (DUF1610 family)